jgi:hypothetical protein
MKQWRVGTLSMGVSLVMLGIMLFMSQWRGLEALDTFLKWWPMIFVLLGLELLIYLAVSRLTNPVVKYDIFSMFFVGFICMVCMGFVVLTSTGLMQEIRSEINSVDRTEDIPGIEEQLQPQVKKVVVQNNNGSEILVDQSQASEQSVHVFGSYRYTSSEGENQLKLLDSVVSVRTIGDTMYVNIEQPPQRNGLHSSYPYMNVTVVIPEGLTTEISGNHKLI